MSQPPFTVCVLTIPRLRRCLQRHTRDCRRLVDVNVSPALALIDANRLDRHCHPVMLSGAA
jgi:hypothetical protein